VSIKGREFLDCYVLEKGSHPWNWLSKVVICMNNDISYHFPQIAIYYTLHRLRYFPDYWMKHIKNLVALYMDKGIEFIIEVGKPIGIPLPQGGHAA